MELECIGRARRTGETLERPPQTAGEPTSSLIEAGGEPTRVATYADTILRVSYTYLHSTQDAGGHLPRGPSSKPSAARRGFESAEHERAWIIRVAINAAEGPPEAPNRTRHRGARRHRRSPPRRDEPRNTRARSPRGGRPGASWPCPGIPRGDLPPLLRGAIPSSRSPPSSMHPNRPWQRGFSRGRSKLRPALEGVRHELDL